MKSIPIFIALALVADIIGTYGMIASKAWVAGRGTAYLIASLAAGVVCSALWYVCLKIQVDLGKTYVLWAVSGTVTAVLLGRFYFHETFSPGQWAGFILCTVGSVMVAWK